MRETTASFDVDPQNGFTPNCPYELPVPGGDSIVEELNAQAKYAKFRVASKDSHSRRALWVADSKKPQFSAITGHKNLDFYWNLHCEVGTFGHEFIRGLPGVLDYDFVVHKGIENDIHPYGACYHDLAETRTTGVIEFLKYNGVKTVIVGGLATEYCVKTTVVQLVKAGFEVILNIAACRGLSESGIKAAVEEMKAAGVRIVNSHNEIGGENV